MLKNLLRRACSRENLYALLLCLIVLALTILTADTTPTWIYHGF